MSVTIRPGLATDWEGFQAAFGAVAAEGRWIGTEVPVDWDRLRPTFAAHIDDARWLLLLVFDDDRIVGWAVVEHQRTGMATLGMGLVEGYRGVGIGSQLMAQVIDWARQRGAHKVCLEVWPHNTAARGLYERHGFIVEGRHPRHWRRNDGSLWDALSMGLILDDESPGGPSR